MTWSPDVPPTFRGETAKIRFRAAPYCRGSGLDVGCGPWKVFSNAIGVDGQRYVGAAGGPSLVMACEKLPLIASESVAYVYSSHLLEHIVDTEAALREWLRVIETGGYLVLYLPHKAYYPNIGQFGANPDHKHDFVPEDIVAVMRKIGGVEMIENESRSDLDEYSFFQVYRKRADRKFVDLVQPRPAKMAAIVRPGVYGDALWASSPAAALKREGYHVTVYVDPQGEEVLRLDPNIDRLIVIDRAVVPVEQYGALWEAEKPRYDRWINLVESCEVRLLFTAGQVPFTWPKAVRHDHANRNYLREIHAIAELPYSLEQRFYPSADEKLWATNKRREFLKAGNGQVGQSRLVVITPAGSTWPKYWPWCDALAKRLADEGTHVVILGDTRDRKFDVSPFIHVVGISWSIRQAMTFVQQADVVVGQETGLLNSVAVETMRKVVLLSHSTPRNLTEDWLNTVALAGNAPCYPCHQIHLQAHTCSKGPQGYAACQEKISVEDVWQAIHAPQLVAPQQWNKVA